MELVHKVFPLASSLLCLIAVVVSLFNLIDKAEGASPSPSSRNLESQVPTTTARLPLPASPAIATINASIYHPPPSPSPGRDGKEGEEEARLLFVAPGLMKKKKRLAALRKNATEAEAAAAAAAKTTAGPPSHVIFSERMEEYAFDNNGTEIIDTRNKTMTSSSSATSNNDNHQTTADPLCPDKNNRKCTQENLQRAGTNAQQSTLPALELILGAAVHVIIFVVFLYFWKVVYYPVVDPYATVSPYGFDSVTPPSKKRAMTDHLDSIMHTLEKSVTDNQRDNKFLLL